MIIFLIIWSIFFKCKTGEKDKCKICGFFLSSKCLSCYPDYELYKGKCITYTIKPIYKTDSNDQKISLINSKFIKKIAKMKLGNDDITPSSEYKFLSSSEHTIFFYFMKKKITSLSSMFKDITKLKSISFHPFIDTTRITDMSYMFYNDYSLISIDFSGFIFQKLN